MTSRAVDTHTRARVGSCRYLPSGAVYMTITHPGGCMNIAAQPSGRSMWHARIQGVHDGNVDAMVHPYDDRIDVGTITFHVDLANLRRLLDGDQTPYGLTLVPDNPTTDPATERVQETPMDTTEIPPLGDHLTATQLHDLYGTGPTTLARAKERGHLKVTGRSGRHLLYRHRDVVGLYVEGHLQKPRAPKDQPGRKGKRERLLRAMDCVKAERAVASGDVRTYTVDEAAAAAGVKRSSVGALSRRDGKFGRAWDEATGLYVYIADDVDAYARGRGEDPVANLAQLHAPDKPPEADHARCGNTRADGVRCELPDGHTGYCHPQPPASEPDPEPVVGRDAPVPALQTFAEAMLDESRERPEDPTWRMVGRMALSALRDV